MLAMNIPDALEAKLKIAARQRGKKPADMAMEALEHWLDTEEWAACRASSHEPNEETITAIRESKEYSGAKTYTTTAELFEELDKIC